MQSLIDLRNKMVSLNVQIYLILQEAFNDPTVKAQIEDKIIEQLQRGERGDGEKLPNYSPVSVAVYGKPAGPIKLFDTGDFYRGVTIEVTREGIIIYDTDGKTETLVVDYGKEILELQEQSIDEINQDVIIPVVQSKLIQYLR